MSIVNRNEFAEIIGKSSKWIGKLIESGMPISGGGGVKGKPLLIDTEYAIKWLIKKEVSKQIGDIVESCLNNSPKEGTKDGEELLTAIAKRRKAVVEANKAESSVIRVEELSQFIYSIATIYSNSLNSFGTRLAPEVSLINEETICKQKIDQECTRVMQATAGQLRSFVDETMNTYDQ